MTEIRIIEGGLDDPRVVALLQHHVALARGMSPPGSSHALDLDALKTPEIRFWTAWAGETLAGTVALKRLDAQDGEVKSMHAAEALRGRGVGAALLGQVLAAARAMGLVRLSLETGAQPYFAASRRLYARHGFAPCPAFPPYRHDPNSVFMTLDLAASPADGAGEGRGLY
jgi:putative acetyltransferase